MTSLLAHPLMTTSNLAVIFDRLPISWHDRYSLACTCRPFMTAVGVSRKWKTVTTLTMRDVDQRILINERDDLFGGSECWANESDRRKVRWFLKNLHHLECLTLQLADCRYVNVQRFLLTTIIDSRTKNRFEKVEHLILTMQVNNRDVVAKIGELLLKFTHAKLKARIFANSLFHRSTCSLLYKIGLHSQLDKLYLSTDGLHPKVLQTMLTYFKGKPCRQLHLDFLLPTLSLATLGRQMVSKLSRSDLPRALANLINQLAVGSLRNLKLGLYNCAYRNLAFLVEHIRPDALVELDSLRIFVRPPCRAQEVLLTVQLLQTLATASPKLRSCRIEHVTGGFVQEGLTEHARIQPYLLASTPSTSRHAAVDQMSSWLDAALPMSSGHSRTSSRRSRLRASSSADFSRPATSRGYYPPNQTEGHLPTGGRTGGPPPSTMVNHVDPLLPLPNHTGRYLLHLRDENSRRPPDRHLIDHYALMNHVGGSSGGASTSTGSGGNGGGGGCHTPESCCCANRTASLDGDQLVQIVNVWNERLNVQIEDIVLGDLVVDSERRANQLLHTWPNGALLRDDDDRTMLTFRLPCSSGEIHLDVRLHIIPRQHLAFR